MPHIVLRSLMLCLFGLCLALPRPGLAAAPPAAPSWEGAYMGENAILRIDNLSNGRSFLYVFEDRENAEHTRNGQAEVAEQAPREGRGPGFRFLLSKDGSTVTVTTRKSDKPAGNAKRAGRYIRLDSLEQKNGRLVMRQTGKPLPAALAKLAPVANAAMRYAVISAADIQEHKLPLRPGLYLVTANGQVEYFPGYVPGAEHGGSPEYFAGMTDAVSLSPDKTVLAIGSFPALNGDWRFFSWPELKPLAHPRLAALHNDSPPLLWGGKRQVVVDCMPAGGGKTARPCGYDPCGPVSVVAYDPDTGKSTTLFQGTDRCDYRGQSVTDGTVTATKRCQPTAAAWKTYPESGPTETVSAPLP